MEEQMMYKIILIRLVPTGFLKFDFLSKDAQLISQSWEMTKYFYNITCFGKNLPFQSHAMRLTSLDMSGLIAKTLIEIKLQIFDCSNGKSATHAAVGSTKLLKFGINLRLNTVLYRQLIFRHCNPQICIVFLLYKQTALKTM